MFGLSSDLAVHGVAVNTQLIERLNLRAWAPGLVLEGGSIDVNGRGVLMTTEECLLSPIQARNPDLSRTDVEDVLADFLGVRKVLWLNAGIAGDWFAAVGACTDFAGVG